MNGEPPNGRAGSPSPGAVPSWAAGGLDVSSIHPAPLQGLPWTFQLRRGVRAAVREGARRGLQTAVTGPHATTDWPNDLALVRAAQRGEPRAVQALADRLACIPGMVRARNRRLGGRLSPHEIEEIVQETVLAMWPKLERYTGGSPIEAWAYGFVVRQHYKAYERARRGPQGVPCTDLEAEGTQPGELDEGEHRRLHEAIQSLDDSTAEIIHRKVFDGLTFEQIAQELGESINTVKTRYYRGLRRLRERLRGLWKERRP